jgi:hypothetical protein
MSAYKQFVSNGIIEDGIVRGSDINTSTIDMNNGVITTHGTPINNLDVVNKAYVDARIKTFTINLSGTSPVVLPISILKGSLSVNIFSIVNDGPTASFNINKSYTSINGAIHRTNTSAGQTSYERLMMDWPSGGSPRIYKTGSNYDGIYQIFLIANYILL